MDRFPSLCAAWVVVSPVMRAGLVGADLVTPEVFRNAWDGTAEEAKELVDASGGHADDVEGLMGLWVLVERPAIRAIARSANFQSSEATATVEISRKRTAVDMTPCP